MHWKYIVKSYKTKLISQARRQVAMLKICVALNKERGDCPLVLIIACHNHIVMSLFFKISIAHYKLPSLTVKRRKKFKKAGKSGKDEDFAISWNDVIFRVVW